MTQLTTAISSGLLPCGFWSEIDTRSGVGPQISRASLIEWEFVCDCPEEFLDIGSGLGGSLEEEQVGFFGVSLSIGSLNDSLIGVIGDHVDFVSGEGDDDVFVGLSL